MTVSVANAKTFGEAWDHLTGAPLAHRGLWAPDAAPENSLGAFQHAAENGYGVELDVRLSADGEAMVFHDDTLARMTGAEGRVRDQSAKAVGPLEQRVHDVLLDHQGPVAVIGFNAYSHAWFADRFPKILRGLNSHAYADGEARMSAEAVAALRALEHVAIAHPHFLALGLDMLPDAKAAEHRVKGLPVVAWTVRSPDQWSAVSEACDNYIFEGFTPPKGL